MKPVTNVINRATHTGHIGGGQIFVTELLAGPRIRTGVTDTDAI